MHKTLDEFEFLQYWIIASLVTVTLHFVVLQVHMACLYFFEPAVNWRSRLANLHSISTSVLLSYFVQRSNETSMGTSRLVAIMEVSNFASIISSLLQFTVY